VLNPIPPKHRRKDPEVLAGLAALAEKAPEETVPVHLKAVGFRGATFNALRLTTNLGDKALEAALGGYLSRRELVLVDRESRLYIHAEVFESVCRTLADYHAAQPLQSGMGREELKSKLPRHIGVKLFTLALNQLAKDGTVSSEADLVRLSGHEVSLGIDQEALRETLVDTYSRAGIMPPYFKEVVQELGISAAKGKEVLGLLVREGTLTKVKEDLFFHTEAVEELRGRLVSFLKEKGEITTPEFKDMTGASRKYVIPLAEHFDACQVTLRVGDVRKLRKG
jgi:selenocysteine-specific elongation factor